MGSRRGLLTYIAIGGAHPLLPPPKSKSLAAYLAPFVDPHHTGAQDARSSLTAHCAAHATQLLAASSTLIVSQKSNGSKHIAALLQNAKGDPFTPVCSDTSVSPSSRAAQGVRRCNGVVPGSRIDTGCLAALPRVPGRSAPQDAEAHGACGAGARLRHHQRGMAAEATANSSRGGCRCSCCSR